MKVKLKKNIKFTNLTFKNLPQQMSLTVALPCSTVESTGPVTKVGLITVSSQRFEAKNYQSYILIKIIFKKYHPANANIAKRFFPPKFWILRKNPLSAPFVVVFAASFSKKAACQVPPTSSILSRQKRIHRFDARLKKIREYSQNFLNFTNFVNKFKLPPKDKKYI